MSTKTAIKILLTVQAILIGVITALVAGILATIAGAVIAQAFVFGGVAFASAVTLTLLVQGALSK